MMVELLAEDELNYQLLLLMVISLLLMIYDHLILLEMLIKALAEYIPIPMFNRLVSFYVVALGTVVVMPVLLR